MSGAGYMNGNTRARSKRVIIFKDHIPKSFFSYGSLTQDANFEEI